MFLKITDEGSPVPSDNEHSVYADVVACAFRRRKDGGEARLYVREPIKTAMVPGFHEVERFVAFTGAAYLMNEQGRTISTFTARTSGQVHAPPEEA